MTLQELIGKLGALDQSTVLSPAFKGGHSWRGSYEQLAFMPVESATVGEMLADAKAMIGKTIHGWKGGEFLVSLHTNCNVAAPGDYGGDTDDMGIWWASNVECGLLRADLLASRAEVAALKDDQTDWRKGVELIASALGLKTLACVSIADAALELRAKLAEAEGKVAQLTEQVATEYVRGRDHQMAAANDQCPLRVEADREALAEATLTEAIRLAIHAHRFDNNKPPILTDEAIARIAADVALALLATAKPVEAGVCVAEGVVEKVSGNDERWYINCGNGTFHFTSTSLVGFDGHRVRILVVRADKGGE